MVVSEAASTSSTETGLTTQQAADILHVSRPYLTHLLEENRIPSRMAGTHRLVRFEDIKEYKDVIDANRRKALEQLTAEAQKLGLGY